MEISFIGNCIRSHEASNAAASEWQYVAMVIDRLLLWIFLAATIIGTVAIFLDPVINPEFTFQ